MKRVSTTVLAKVHGLSAKELFAKFSELGYIERHANRWKLTALGKTMGGEYREAEHHAEYIVWPEHVEISTGVDAPEVSSAQDKIGFREKYPANHRSVDGHMVRSKAEMLIDNWLYMAGVVHAYERKLPIEEPVYCDFYIPEGKVFIEYWGSEKDTRYLTRKRTKIDIYQRYNLHLIELDDRDVQNLDDVLPELLLKYKVQTHGWQ